MRLGPGKRAAAPGAQQRARPGQPREFRDGPSQPPLGKPDTRFQAAAARRPLPGALSGLPTLERASPTRRGRGARCGSAGAVRSGRRMEAGDQEVSSMKLQTLQLLPEEQIVTLRQQMVESQASYQRKLQSSQEAQHRQAVLVQKLQAKGPLSHRWEAKEEHSLERALVQLEEEQQRCENLAEVNTLLREHLSKANEVNTALREDVQKLTVDWTRARDELELKESEWRTEREFFDGYLRCEHDRLLSLWRQVVTFRRHFLEMKTATDSEYKQVKIPNTTI
nr:centrosome-associated protein CEP250-like isoform X2 [Chrysemys picta bellii]